jgi:hypothetical protein
MSDKLPTLTRLHRWRLDEERRGLAAAMRELDLRESALRELEAEIASEQESARTGPADAGIDYGSYARWAAQRRASCHEAIGDGRGRGVAETGTGAELLPAAAHLRTRRREPMPARDGRSITARAARARRDRAAHPIAPGARRPLGVGQRRNPHQRDDGSVPVSPTTDLLAPQTDRASRLRSREERNRRHTV